MLPPAGRPELLLGAAGDAASGGLRCYHGRPELLPWSVDVAANLLGVSALVPQGMDGDATAESRQFCRRWSVLLAGANMLPAVVKRLG